MTPGPDIKGLRDWGNYAPSGKQFRNSRRLDVTFLFASPSFFRLQVPEFESSYGPVTYREEFEMVRSAMAEQKKKSINYRRAPATIHFFEDSLKRET